MSTLTVSVCWDQPINNGAIITGYKLEIACVTPLLSVNDEDDNSDDDSDEEEEEDEPVEDEDGGDGTHDEGDESEVKI